MSIRYFFPTLRLSLFKGFCTLGLLSLTFNITAQQRCGIPLYQLLQSKDAVSEGEEQFEEWLQQKRAARDSKHLNLRKEATTYQIQVVVHVIHNGEAIGDETNIPDAQIVSQLEVLNEDFKRLIQTLQILPRNFNPAREA